MDEDVTKKIPESLPDIIVDKKARDEQTAITNNNYSERRDAAEITKLEERNENIKANRKLREAYATKVYIYLVVYSSVVGVMLFASGLDCIPFLLSDNVLEILVGSTAVSAIGLVLAVTLGLFKNLDNN